MVARFFSLFGFFSFLFLVGCQSSEKALPTPDNQSVQLTSGFAPVVRIHSIGQLCTGVLVSPRALLTASHCVRENSRVSVLSDFGQFDSNLVIKFGPGREYDSRDLAVVIFSQDLLAPQSVYSVGNASVGETVFLVGYGCTNAVSRTGAGAKRFGSNSVYRLSEYIEVLSPVRAPSQAILGPFNRAGSCFGDSGGPLLRPNGNSYSVVGIDHAVIAEDGQQVSAYTHLYRQDNRTFLQSVDSQYQLRIQGLH